MTFELYNVTNPGSAEFAAEVQALMRKHGMVRYIVAMHIEQYDDNPANLEINWMQRGVIMDTSEGWHPNPPRGVVDAVIDACLPIRLSEASEAA